MQSKWLKAGPLDVFFEDGAVRYIKYGTIELVRGIYSAVRDKNWDTILPTLRYNKLKIMDSGFHIEFTAIHKRDDIHFEAEYSLVGNESGQIEFSMDGKALSSFLKNRIGFCVLHPIKECVNQPLTIKHSNGTEKIYTFPELVSPHQPFKDICSMQINTPHYGEVLLNFEGDIFETEDQRNWSDASFKTYCTPLGNPFPAQVVEGQPIKQKITFKLLQLPQIDSNSLKNKQSETSKKPFSVKIGLGLSDKAQELTAFQVEKLKLLNLNHLRIDIKLFSAGWESVLTNALRQSAQLHTKLELALHFGDSINEQLDNFLVFNGLEDDKIEKIIVYIYRKHGWTNDFYENVVLKIKQKYPSVAIGGGTDANFAELNRAEINAEQYDFLSYAVNPQVHAFDDTSVIETIEAYGDMIKTAKKKAANKPICISPITLKQRFNPVATDAENTPPLADARQKTVFLAEWTQKCLDEINKHGLDSATLFETVGERGVMDNDLFPVYHVLLNRAK